MWPTRPAIGRIRKKKEDIRDALRQAAAQLFLERGYKAATVEDIVERVGISARTFFRYFGSKDDTLFPPPDQLQHTLAARLAERPAGEAPVLAARAVYRSILNLYTDEERGLAFARLLTQTPALRARLAIAREQGRTAIATALAERMNALPDDLRPNIVAGSVVWTIAAAVDRWVHENGSRPLDAIIEDAFSHIDAAFASEFNRDCVAEHPAASQTSDPTEA